MSLLDSASLVVTPNGYKAGTLYSVVPNTTLGDLDVVRATSATRVDSAGAIETVGNNVPRIDYSNGSCPSILVEPQRTNSLLNSATVANQTIITGAVQYTLSFYGTGTITLSGSHSATVVGTGTTRKTYTFTPTAGILVLTVSGTCTRGQLEAGSYATSEIPTTSSIVTRNADVISKTGISSLIGQTEGTLFIDYNKTHASDEALLGMVYLDANPSNNRLQLVIDSNHFYMYATNGGALGLLSGNISLSNGRNKIAVSYGSNGYKIYLNGTSVYTNATTLTPSTDSFRLGSYAGGIAVMSDSINQSSLWKTQLTNTQLAQLTTI